ncbi:DUF3572 domain-containing protein [Paenirhodobacter populi]|uniref:DUF3572 family protein n=1 Tax=Paenirhodobacter populi TaxID=2306993 RepID=A0A443KN78_9RHOB|nr:DUF3572 domain-containing protein [Sinirhodobacter populi]RWR20832.1 DUF3572 family protein [Sinirhodobacter populi]RWR29722.1 DUF3572 family protein [Sinirhodobacter populi]RWR34104.1 DUF3572 family protein [Sinirhodobacter populi]
MRRDSAQVTGLKVLGWLASEDEIFGAFLGATGASLDDVRAGAEKPAFLISVLDFVLQSDDWVLAAAAAAGQPPQEIGLARAVLGGHDRMHWT